MRNGEGDSGPLHADASVEHRVKSRSTRRGWPASYLKLASRTQGGPNSAASKRLRCASSSMAHDKSLSVDDCRCRAGRCRPRAMNRRRNDAAGRRDRRRRRHDDADGKADASCNQSSRQADERKPFAVDLRSWILRRSAPTKNGTHLHDELARLTRSFASLWDELRRADGAPIPRVRYHTKLVVATV